MFYYIFFALLLIGAIFCAIQISIADMRRRIIPDAYLYPMMIIGLVIVTWFPWVITARMAAAGAAIGYILSMLVGIAFEHFVHSSSRNTPPIGMGDIKLLGVAGLWLGPNGLALALILSCLMGIIWGWRWHQHYIPFAPFLITGAFLSFITIAFLI